MGFDSTILLLKAVAALVCVLLLVIFVWIGFRWLIALGRWGTGNVAERVVPVILAIFIACWFEPATARWLYSFTLSIFEITFIDLPRRLLQVLLVTDPNCGQECWQRLSDRFFDFWQRFSFETIDSLGLRNFPIESAVKFAVLLFITYHGFQLINSRASHLWDGTAKRWLEAMLPAGIHRRNIWLALLLMVGGFLAFGSISAVQILQENPIDVTDDEQSDLSQHLSGMKINDYNQMLQLPDTQIHRIQVQSSRPNNFAFEYVNSVIDRHSYLQLSAADLAVYLNSRQTQAINLATNTFRLASRGRRGAREATSHELSLLLWFQSWVDGAQGQLNSCRSEIAGATRYLISVRDRVIVLDSAEFAAGTNIYESIGEADSRITRAINLCSQTDNKLMPPARVDFGSFLGPFGIMSRAILVSESLWVTLIVGVLGLGLVGAALSEFVRRNVNDTSASDHFHSSLVQIIAQGMASSLVVFLGIYGGVLVLTTGDAHPNPYLVLFACFSAAVFSNEVWNWVLRFIRSTTTQESNRNSAPRPSSISPEVPPAPIPPPPDSPNVPA